MCTLTVAFRTLPDASVVVAANRDELLDRPSEGPARRDWESAVIAPRDAEAGGTWIGFNADGMLAAITNRWLDADLPAERSRGLLVRDALGADSAADAARAVETDLADRSYDGFNLLIADDQAAILFEWDGRLRVTELDPGIHVIMNTGYDEVFEIPTGERGDAARRQAESARMLRAELHPRPDETAAAWLDRAGAVLGDHDYGVCVHQDGFGTRSSSLIALREDGSATYRFAPGPPCRTAFDDVEAEV